MLVTANVNQHMRQLVAAIVLILVLSLSVSAEETWALRADGLGPIRIGMTVGEAQRAVSFPWDKLSYPIDNKDSCYYLESKAHLPGVGVMVLDGKIVRIDIFEGGHRSIRGVRVGDPQAKVRDLYGRMLLETAHNYVGPEGKYFTALSRSKRYGIRYETDGKQVTGFYGGTAKAIEYVEGCS